MNEEKTKICRFCWRAVSEGYEYPNVNPNEMIKIILPTVDLNVCDSSIICKQCDKSIKQAFSFKSACLEIEDNIHNYTNDGKIQVNLEKILGLEQSEEDSGNKGPTKICRTCMAIIKYGSYNWLVADENCSLIEMLQTFLPELDLQLTLNPVLCSKCSNLVATNFVFISQCIKNEEIIMDYLKSNTPEELNLFELKTLFSEKNTVTAIKTEVQIPFEDQQETVQIENNHIKTENEFQNLNENEILEEKIEIVLETKREMFEDTVIFDRELKNVPEVKNELENGPSMDISNGEHVNITHASVVEQLPEKQKTPNTGPLASREIKVAKSLSCSSCGFKAKNVDVLEEHVQICRNLDKLFVCKHCSFTGKLTMMLDHMKTCGICTYCKVESSDLENHEKGCQVRYGTLTCAHCGFKGVKSAMTQHLKSCTKRNLDKLYTCKYCSFKGKLQVVLDHMKKCRICPYCKVEFIELEYHVKVCKVRQEHFEMVTCAHCGYKGIKSAVTSHIKSCTKVPMWSSSTNLHNIQRLSCAHCYFQGNLDDIKRHVLTCKNIVLPSATPPKLSIPPSPTPPKLSIPPSPTPPKLSIPPTPTPPKLLTPPTPKPPKLSTPPPEPVKPVSKYVLTSSSSYTCKTITLEVSNLFSCKYCFYSDSSEKIFNMHRLVCTKFRVNEDDSNSPQTSSQENLPATPEEEDQQSRIEDEQCKTSDEQCKTADEPFKTADEPSKTENEPCKIENEPCKTENEPCKTENEPCKTENGQCETENEPCETVSSETTEDQPSRKRPGQTSKRKRVQSSTRKYVQPHKTDKRRKKNDQPSKTADDQPCKTADDQPCKTAYDQPCKIADDQPCKTADDQPCKTADGQPCKTADGQPCKTADDQDQPRKTADDQPYKTTDSGKASKVSKERSSRVKLIPRKIIKDLSVFKCTLCNYNTRNHFSIEGHVLKHFSHHRKNVVYTCDLCKMNFETVLFFYSHRKREHDMCNYKVCFWCVNCTLVFGEKDEVDDHLKECRQTEKMVRLFRSNAVIFCMMCDYETENLTKAKSHLLACRNRHAFGIC